MKKIIGILIFIPLLLSVYSGVAIDQDEAIYQEQITLHFSQLRINEIQGDITLDLQGSNTMLMKYNHYIIPMRIETLTFPLGTKIKDINCIVKDVHQKVIEKKLMMAPEPVLLGYKNNTSNFQNGTSPVSISTWFDYDIGAGIIGNERKVIVKIQVYPVQYNPVNNFIEWAEEIEIEVEYEESNQTVALMNEYDFIVLCPIDYADELEELIVHKNNRGLKTKLVTLDEIYQSQYFPVEGRDSPEKIKYFIKNTIDEWGIDSVLLVGGYEAFPTRETHIYVEYFDVDEPFVSDLYYADIYNSDVVFQSWDTNENSIFGEYNWGDSHLMDDVDLYPDVHFGRLACIDEEEVIICVNKIITYETNQAYTKEWFTNLVVIGGDTFTDDTWGISEGEYVNEIVMDTLSGFVPEKIWDSNGRLSGPSPSGINEISDAINNGCGFVDFSGHGDPFSWATHPNGDERTWIPKPWGYFNSDISELTNGDKLPIVVLGACSTCKFNVNDNSFGWSFLSNPNGGGIGSFGVTTFGYANGGGREITGGFIEEITMNIFEVYKERANDGLSITFGEMWSMAMMDYIYPNMEVRDYATLESWQSFGDPTLSVAGESQAPEKPTKPSGPTSVEPGISYSYSSSTTDGDEDKVYYLFDWGDGKLSGWIGPYDSGETVDANHSWESKGRHQVRVKAKDEHGVQSEWSNPLTVTMPRFRTLLKIDILRLFDLLNSRFPFISYLINNVEMKI